MTQHRQYHNLNTFNGSFRQGTLFWLITWPLFALLPGTKSVILKVRQANTLLANVC
jgi:hypothetical protein